MKPGKLVSILMSCVVFTLSFGALSCGDDDDDSSDVNSTDDDITDDDAADDDSSDDDTSDDDTADDDSSDDDSADDDSSASCDVTSQPETDTWQSDFTPDSDCSCTAENPDCHAIYKARVTSIDGNEATIEFTKTPNGGPSVDVSYWVTVGAESDASLTCQDVPIYVDRSTGTWNSSDNVLEVTVNIWPSEDECEDASSGEKKFIGLVTGGSDSPNDRIWFTKTAVTFIKD